MSEEILLAAVENLVENEALSSADKLDALCRTPELSDRERRAVRWSELLAAAE